ncbi:MAG: helix-turn-helix domain-containing protein [Nitrosomonadales bacterium]|nr:MAG: helix-turn-helix domain-containing protein [Nitrosomonadales bacterium]
MNENEDIPQQQTEQESAPVASISLDIGKALAEAREKLGLSIQEAAQQLRLSARQLHALEANDYSGLPGATFIRGFVRNYARLLQLDPEPLLHALGAPAPESARNITLQSEDIAISRRDRRLWLPYVVASLLVGLLLGSWMLYMDYRESHPEKHVETAAEPSSAQSAGGYSPESVTLPGTLPNADAPDSAPASELPVAPVASRPVPAPVAKPPVPAAAVQAATPALAGTAHLKLAFSEQSWVRVTDRDGKEIFHKNGAAGSKDSAEGTPPLKVEIGNAAGVQLTFNDKPVNLAPHTKANVARFTLE